MATVHLIVGSLVILAYLAVLIGYFRGTQGRPVAWVRQVSMGAAGLLLLQYALGFMLLGSSDDLPNPLHYVIALATVFTVGAEHMVAGQEPDPLKKNRLGLIFSLGTLVLVFVAYAIGESTS